MGAIGAVDTPESVTTKENRSWSIPSCVFNSSCNCSRSLARLAFVDTCYPFVFVFPLVRGDMESSPSYHRAEQKKERRTDPAFGHGSILQRELNDQECTKATRSICVDKDNVHLGTQ